LSVKSGADLAEGRWLRTSASERAGARHNGAFDVVVAEILRQARELTGNNQIGEAARPRRLL